MADSYGTAVSPLSRSDVDFHMYASWTSGSEGEAARLNARRIIAPVTPLPVDQEAASSATGATLSRRTQTSQTNNAGSCRTGVAKQMKRHGGRQKLPPVTICDPSIDWLMFASQAPRAIMAPMTSARSWAMRLAPVLHHSSGPPRDQGKCVNDGHVDAFVKMVLWTRWSHNGSAGSCGRRVPDWPKRLARGGAACLGGVWHV